MGTHSDEGAGGGASVANWSQASVRYYAISYLTGSDSNAGWSDTSAADAWTRPFKTWAGMLARLPTIGAGRKLRILVNGTGFSENLVLNTLIGYRSIEVWGTTDGSDDSTDRLLSGATTLYSGTVVSSSLPGGGLTQVNLSRSVSTSLSYGYRFRLTSGAASGRAFPIVKNLLADQVTIGDEVTLSAGDAWVIDYPNVQFNNVIINTHVNDFDNDSGSLNTSISLRGIYATTTMYIYGTGARNVKVSFCMAGSVSSQAGNVSFESRYSPVTGGTQNSGVGIICLGSMSLAGARSSYSADSSYVGTTLSLNAPGVTFGRGCRVDGQITCQSVRGPIGSPSSSTNPSGSYIGNEWEGASSIAPIGRLIVASGIEIRNASIAVCGVEFLGGGNITMRGVGQNVVVDDVVGTCTGYVLDLDECWSATVVVGVHTAVTATGASGDISMAAKTPTFASLAGTNVFDEQNNNVLGTGGYVTAVP